MIDQQTRTILNSIQLSIYIITTLITIFKLINAIKYNQTFLIKFYSAIMIITFIEITIQSIEIIDNNQHL